MRGTRVDCTHDLWNGGDLLKGAYCPVIVDGRKTWRCVTPNGHMGTLSKHDVTEHEDGTISVSPSIALSNPQEGELYHGFLERGVWREA